MFEWWFSGPYLDAIVLVRSNFSLWRKNLVKSGVDRRREFVERVGESVAEGVLELAPTLFDRIEFRRIHR